MARKKILLLSVSAGAGHVRAAEALEAWGESRFNVEMSHVDVMTLVPKLFKKIYADSYIHLVQKLPALWGYLYDVTDKEEADSLSSKMRSAVKKLNTSKFDKLIEESDPDIVICTHFLPAELLSKMIRKKRFNKPVYVVVTDFDIHTFWIHPHMSAYFAASEEVAFRMAERGIPSENIRVSGIPVAPQFSRKYSRKDCAKELGINPNLTTILLMSGGVGLEGTEKLAGRLLEMGRGFQIVALAGRNKRLLSSLKRVAQAYPRRLSALPFTNSIERVMACSDLAVTKPGGLTTSECLAMGLPMLIVSPIPGQEERNADYLLEHGASLKAVDAAGVSYRVSKLISEPNSLSRLARNAKRLGQPRAAYSILKTVLSDEP